jgi:hypothetical protein
MTNWSSRSHPVVPVYQGGAALLEQTENGAPMSALLRTAHGSSDERALAGLRAETRRIEAKLAQDREEKEARLAAKPLLQPVVSMVIGPVLLLWPGASLGLLMVVAIANGRVSQMAKLILHRQA